MPIATRLTNTGTLLVNGSFDEVTSIAPAKFRTESTTVYAGMLDEVSLPAGAVSFNGSSTYLSVPYSSNFDFGNGDFTIEFWMYTSSSGNSNRGLMAFSHNASNYAQALWFFSTASTISFWCSSNGTAWDVASNVATGTFALNTWYHVAVSRSGSSIRLFFNGVLQNTVTFAGTLTGTYDRNWIGATTANGYYNGLLSNIRVVKGTAVYTANFTPPQAILPAITNTQLLLNVTDSANFIKDNSTNNLTVTNNGPATWTTTGPFNQGSTVLKQRQVNDGTLEVSTQFDEFTGAPVVDSSLTMWLDFGQTASYSGSGATVTDLSPTPTANVTLVGTPTFNSTDGGGSETFNGTSQYGTGSGAPLGSSAYTKSFWFQLSSYGVNNNVVSGATGQHFSYFGGGTRLQNGHSFWGNFGAFSSVTTFSLNTWYHAVVTFNTATGMALYVNGALDSTYVSTSGTSRTDTALTGNGQVDIAQFGGGNLLSGKIGQVMIYNRALTADEVATNFNALRGRYGI
jgi:hypothetical protein